jgi:AcrR family transcriptional regulator
MTALGNLGPERLEATSELRAGGQIIPLMQLTEKTLQLISRGQWNVHPVVVSDAMLKPLFEAIGELEDADQIEVLRRLIELLRRLNDGPVRVTLFDPLFNRVRGPLTAAGSMLLAELAEKIPGLWKQLADPRAVFEEILEVARTPPHDSNSQLLVRLAKVAALIHWGESEAIFEMMAGTPHNAVSAVLNQRAAMFGLVKMADLKLAFMEILTAAKGLKSHDQSQILQALLVKSIRYLDIADRPAQVGAIDEAAEMLEPHDRAEVREALSQVDRLLPLEQQLWVFSSGTEAYSGLRPQDWARLKSELEIVRQSEEASARTQEQASPAQPDVERFDRRPGPR